MHCKNWEPLAMDSHLNTFILFSFSNKHSISMSFDKSIKSFPFEDELRRWTNMANDLAVRDKSVKVGSMIALCIYVS